MIVDLEKDDLPQQIDADICIIGGGPAGITLALELANTSLDVVLLESGGETYSVRTQALNDGQNVGRDYYMLQHDRVRYLGGTTHHWGGWCVPLTPTDLTTRDWVPNSGWPIAWEELERYYEPAQRHCELDRLSYEPAEWLGDRYPLLDFAADTLENYLYKWSPADPWRPPTHFGKVYRDTLASAPNLRVVLHANLTDFDLNDAVSNVRRVSARTLDGRTLDVQARQFVLAAGGIENPRILLNANRQAPNGLGNDRGLVGRYFMEHMEGLVAHIHFENARDAQWLASYQKRMPENERVSVAAAIRTSPAAQQRLQILNTGMVLQANVDSTSGYVAAKRLATSVLDGRGSDVVADAANVVTDLDEVAKWLYHRQRGTQYEFPVTADPADVWVNAEQSPDPSSRVTLCDDRDELGLRKAALDWRLCEQDKRTLIESVKLLGEELARTRRVRVQMNEWLAADGDDLPDDELVGGHHHMGTTRMADSPEFGVVDADCCVHGIDNLYVAGSSVFPTGGYANPTLTIVALAVRLAGRLQSVSRG